MASTKLSIRRGRPDPAATGAAPCVRVLLPKRTTTSMEQSASCGANSLSTSQGIPRILWNTKVHCRAHKSPPTLPILSHNYPVQTSPTPSCFFYFLSYHLRLGLTSGSFPLVSPTNIMYALLSPYVTNAPSSHSSWCPTRIIFGEQ